MDYPREAELNEIEGTILVSFDLDSTCVLYNIEQDTILGYGCDDAMFDSLCELEQLLKTDFKGNCQPIIRATLPAVFELDREAVGWK